MIYDTLKFSSDLFRTNLTTFNSEKREPRPPKVEYKLGG